MQGTTAEMIHDSTIDNLRRAFQTVERTLIAECSKIGLTPRLLTVILTLDERPRLTAVEIERATGFDKSTTMFVIRELVKRKLIKRTESAVNPNYKHNELSAAGREAAKKGRSIHAYIEGLVTRVAKDGAFRRKLQKITAVNFAALNGKAGLD